MQHYFKLSVFLRTTCRGRNWHSGESDLLTCPMSWHLFFSTASLVSPVSQPSWTHTLSWPPKLHPTLHTPSVLWEIRQNLLPFNSSIPQSLMSLRVSAFSISSNYAKWGFQDMKRILKIAGPLFAHIYMNPYSVKRGKNWVQKDFSSSGKNLLCHLPVGLVLFCYVCQFCPFNVCTTRRYASPRNMLKSEFVITAKSYKIVLCGWSQSSSAWPLFPILNPLAKLLLSSPSHVQFKTKDQKGQHSVNNQNNPFKVEKISFQSFWVQIIAGVMCY